MTIRMLPPSYLGADTCAICWEPMPVLLADDQPWLFRWLFRLEESLELRSHRRKWGHIPEPLYPRESDAARHQRMVAAAREARERQTGC